MATEIELKLRFAPPHVPALITRLNQLAERQDTLTLRNHYYDTPDAALSASGCALRIRQSGERWEQTLKTRGTSTAGLQQRGEWNWPLPNAQLDGSLLHQEDVLDHWPSTIDPDRLQPLFTTHFERHQWIWQQADHRIEIVMDQGSVQASQADDSNSERFLCELPLCELELELLDGDISHLWQLANQLCQATPLWLSDISKAERGYRLAIPDTDWSPETGSIEGQSPLTQLNTLLTLLKRTLEYHVWHDLPTPLREGHELITAIRALLPHLPQSYPAEYFQQQNQNQNQNQQRLEHTLPEHALAELENYLLHSLSQTGGSAPASYHLLTLAHWVWQCHCDTPIHHHPHQEG